MLRLSARRQRLATKAGSVLVLLLAVLPQVLYLGHPRAASDSAVQTTSAHHQHREKTEAEHANHCHVGPKSCAGSDGAVAAALLSSVTSALPHDGHSYALESADPIRTLALYQRPEKPPRTA